MLNASLFGSLAQAHQVLEDWLTGYNSVRSHESLDKEMLLAYLPKAINAEICAIELST